MEQHDDSKGVKECVDSHTMNHLRNKLMAISEEYEGRDQYLGTYSSYIGSPMHEGKLQHDLWKNAINPSDLWPWESLRKDIKKYGVRNSLLLVPIPTIQPKYWVHMNALNHLKRTFTRDRLWRENIWFGMNI